MRTIKLPKQWHHWCYRLKLEDTIKRRKYRNKFVSLKGHGRLWRINSLGQFQYSEIYEMFDKWSNSTEGTFDMPTTFKELEFIVKKAMK